MYARTDQQVLAFVLANVQIDPNTGCWLWQRQCRYNGYALVGYRGQKKQTAHVIYELVNGRRFLWDHSSCILTHKCDNPKCVYPLHLKVGTQFYNIQDCKSKGRSNTASKGSKGELNPKAKLIAADIIIIKQRLANGEKASIIANDYNVHVGTIYRIGSGKIWGFVTRIAL